MIRHDKTEEKISAKNLITGKFRNITEMSTELDEDTINKDEGINVKITDVVNIGQTDSKKEWEMIVCTIQKDTNLIYGEVLPSRMQNQRGTR